MTIAFQVFTTLALVLGIFIGSMLSSKAFGVHKKWWYHLIEIGLFVLVIVIFFNTVELEVYSEGIVYFISFLVGLTCIVFIRGIISGMGFFSIRFKEEILKHKNELDYIIGLRKALKRRDFDKKEIDKIYKEVGFSKKNINKVDEFFKK